MNWRRAVRHTAEVTESASGPGPRPVGTASSVRSKKRYGVLASNGFKHVPSLSVGAR